MADKERNRQAFAFHGGRTGVLLIHGFTGSPGELLPLAERLASRGYSIRVPVLAGHCTTVQEMNRTAEADWIESARSAYHELADCADRVVIIGHSMGGLIALHLAKNHPVMAVVSICTPIFVTSRISWAAPILWPVYPIHRTPPSPTSNMDQYLGGYGETPVRAVARFHRLLRNVKGELPSIQSPLLILQSRRDLTVKPQSAEYIYRHAGSPDKQIKWYQKSGHMLPVDVDKEQAWDDIATFIHARERGATP